MPKPLVHKEIFPESSLSDELGIDSLGLMTLSVSLEDAYGVSLEDYVEPLMAAKSAADLQTFMHICLGQAAGNA